MPAVGAGMQVPAIRDELFSMITRQLSDNIVSPPNVLKDLWGILFVYLHAFRPSALFVPYLVAFIISFCLDPAHDERDLGWPTFVLQQIVGSEIPLREMSVMKADLDRKVRGALVSRKRCSVSGTLWHITQRELDAYISAGKKVPDRAPEYRSDIEAKSSHSLTSTHLGAGGRLPSYMKGTALRPAVGQRSPPKAHIDLPRPLELED